MKPSQIASVFLLFLIATLLPRVLAQQGETGLQPPGPDVPSNCAAFAGGWSGEWPRAGRIYLWVVSVAPDCAAQVIYGKAAKPSPDAKRTQVSIKGDTLTLPRPDGGTTIFDMKVNAIMGHYRGPAGFNEALMERVAVDAVDRLEAEQRALAAVIPLAADVPHECAAFHGLWTGLWGQGNFGEQYLRIVEVKAVNGRCTARLSYSGSKAAIPARDTAEISNGAMAFVCNSSTGGTCVFKFSSGGLSATYSNPAGGRNNATFTKVQ